MALKQAVIAACLFTYVYLVHGNCECGYRTNAGDRFTHRITNDFSDSEDTTDDSSLVAALADWNVQNWKAEAILEKGVIAKQNEIANVWLKGGELHLQQKGYNEGNYEAVSVAELHSQRSDIFHGSFSMMYKVVRQPGASGGSVAGFFFYHDDAVESDVEILTKDADGASIHYTNHPAYDTTTNKTIPGASFKHNLSKSWEDYQEHKFDWTNEATRFYQDENLDREIRTNVPQKSGKIMINLWANNGSWSGVPSNKDVIMSIRHVTLCFNTTSSDAGKDQDFIAKCDAAGGFYNESAICSPDTPLQQTFNSSAAEKTVNIIAVFCMALLVRYISLIL